MTRCGIRLPGFLLLAALLPSCRSAPPASTTVPAVPLSTPAATPLAEPVERPALTTPLGRTVRVLDSDESDSYDDPTVPLSFDASSDTFAGTDRRATKLSLVDDPLEEYATVEELSTTLEYDDDMIQRDPPISRSAKSRRVAEEKRNVQVDGQLCAASREDDNDFHLIVCDDPDVPEEERYCPNIEVSGPPASGAYHARLVAAREQFVELVGGNPPGSKYRFYDPCIPVRIRGSLFYDISHPPGAVGPSKLRPDTAWEIHPVESISERPEDRRRQEPTDHTEVTHESPHQPERARSPVRPTPHGACGS